MSVLIFHRFLEDFAFIISLHKTIFIRIIVRGLSESYPYCQVLCWIILSSSGSVYRYEIGNHSDDRWSVLCRGVASVVYQFTVFRSDDVTFLMGLLCTMNADISTISMLVRAGFGQGAYHSRPDIISRLRKSRKKDKWFIEMYILWTVTWLTFSVSEFYWIVW